MDKLSLIKRITRAKTDEIIHTSGYARVQNGGNIGAGSPQSFSERQAIEDNRQYVRSYRYSQIGANPYNNCIKKSNASPVNSNNINTEKSNSNTLKYGNTNDKITARTPALGSNLASTPRYARKGLSEAGSRHNARDSHNRHNSPSTASQAPIQGKTPVRPPLSSIKPSIRPKF